MHWPHDPRFYQLYLVDHTARRQYMLKQMLDNYDDLTPKVMADYHALDDKAFKDSLRLELRAGYFAAIETMFEMIFGLEPIEGARYDGQLWFRLSSSNWRLNYKRIQSIAKGDLDFLDARVRINPKLEVSVAEYIFYFGVANAYDRDLINSGLQGIKTLLKTVAQDFVDRDEYNAIKHSVRLFQTLNGVGIRSADGRELPPELADLSESMTYLREAGDIPEMVVKPLDSDRDYRLSIVCWQMISNIIRLRRAYFFPSERENTQVFFLTEGDVMEAGERKFKLTYFSWRWERVTDEGEDA